jgi:glycosyltransferase involved in cell wall biosynthesis
MVTKDRPALFEQSIRSLYANTVGKFDLTVVDDCSDDLRPVSLLAEEFGFSATWNTQPTPLGGSKNKALRGKDGLCYLTDNDVYFTPGWDEDLLAAWKNRDPKIKLLGGGCHPYLKTNRIDQHDGYQIHYKDAISGYSWLLEHETWKQYGPLDANALGSGQSEDWAFCQRIKADGYEVASIWPEVVIHTGLTTTEGRPAVGGETFLRLVGVLIE